jgi:hypothetical protein
MKGIIHDLREVRNSKQLIKKNKEMINYFARIYKKIHQCHIQTQLSKDNST